MIECDVCGNYFHADDISDCPNQECTKEICEGCYQKHVSICISDDFMDEYEEDRHSYIIQKSLEGLYFDKNLFDINKKHLIDVARDDERLGALGEVFITELSPTELEDALSNLEIEYVEIDEDGDEVNSWMVSYIND